MSSGAKVISAFIRETVAGTTPASGDWSLLKRTSWGVKPTQNKSENNEIGGSRMTEDDARPEALRRFELMVEEVARNASAVAQNTAAAKKSARQAEEYKNDASEYARNKFTFYKTSSDPDGTIAGLAATTDGQSFWVAQGPDALSAAW